MSIQHAAELYLVLREFDAVRASLIYALSNWPSAAPEMAPIKRYDLAGALDRLEATYIVRLTASYEATVFEILTDKTQQVLSTKMGGVELTNRLSRWLQTETKITAGYSRPGTQERNRIREIRAHASRVENLMQYRNRVAHRVPDGGPSVTFRKALTCLTVMLDYVP